jgi:hypothetical protein
MCSWSCVQLPVPQKIIPKTRYEKSNHTSLPSWILDKAWRQSDLPKVTSPLAAYFTVTLKPVSSDHQLRAVFIRPLTVQDGCVNSITNWGRWKPTGLGWKSSQSLWAFITSFLDPTEWRLRPWSPKSLWAPSHYILPMRLWAYTWPLWASSVDIMMASTSQDYRTRVSWWLNAQEYM